MDLILISNITAILVLIGGWTLFIYLLEYWFLDKIGRVNTFLTPTIICANTKLNIGVSWLIVILFRIFNPIYSIYILIYWLIHRKENC